MKWVRASALLTLMFLFACEEVDQGFEEGVELLNNRIEGNVLAEITISPEGRYTASQTVSHAVVQEEPQNRPIQDPSGAVIKVLEDGTIEFYDHFLGDNDSTGLVLRQSEQLDPEQIEILSQGRSLEPFLEFEFDEADSGQEGSEIVFFKVNINGRLTTLKRKLNGSTMVRKDRSAAENAIVDLLQSLMAF